MAGMRMWHGRSHTYSVDQDTTVPGTFVYHLYDSSVNHAFDLTVIDSATIQFDGGYTLHMDSVNTDAHLVYFTRTAHDYRYPAYCYIIYYYLADSMSYHYADDYHSLDNYINLSTP